MNRNSIRIISALLVLIQCTVFLTGCSQSGLDYDPNDYITKVGQYAGLVIVREDTTVTEQEVLDAIYADLGDYCQIQDVTEGTVAEGDRVLMDFTGSVDGQVYDNTQAKDYDYVLGSGKLLSGIDDNLYGKSVGQPFTLEIQLPENYYDADLAGKVMSLQITIKAKRVTIMPELTDEFVADLEVSEFQTVSEMKEYYKSSIKASKEEMADEKQVNDLWQRILDSYELSELPSKAVNAYVDALISETEANAEEYGVTFLNMLSYMGFASESEYKSYCYEQAQDAVRQDIVFYHIIQEVGISHTKRDAKAFAEDNYLQFGYKSGQELIDEYGIDYIIEYLNKDALWTYLLENNQL